MRCTINFFICFSFLAQGQINDPLIVNLSDHLDQQKWVDSVYQNLSLEEKIGQLFMPMVFTEKDSLHYIQILKLDNEVGNPFLVREGIFK